MSEHPTSERPTSERDVQLGWWLSSEEHGPRDLVAHARLAEESGFRTAMSGFWPRRDRRLAAHVRATVAALEEGPFLRRYPAADDGFEGREGDFVPASWWAVSALAIIGDLDTAQRRADDMCAQLPPLLPEEWDVASSTALGNTPLLWSHSEAARALYTLQREQQRARIGTVGVATWQRARALRLRLATRWIDGGLRHRRITTAGVPSGAGPGRPR